MLRTIISHVYQVAREGKWQVFISVLIGIIAIIASFIEKRQGGAVLLAFGSYFAFLIGVGAVTILVTSMAIGLLIYYFQSAQTGRNYYYDKFRDAAAALRSCLDSLHDDGFIGSGYNERYRDIELLTMENLPVGWKENFIPFLENIFGELRENLRSEDEYNRVSGSVEVKVIVLNEAVSGLWVNLIQRVGMKIWISPLVKSFWTLALTILAAIVGAIYFTGIGAHILVGLAIGIGCMTILLILEIGFIAVKESREFFNDETDVDHSQAEAHAQASREEEPRSGG
jgi:hypothetical protein